MTSTFDKSDHVFPHDARSGSDKCSGRSPFKRNGSAPYKKHGLPPYKTFDRNHRLPSYKKIGRNRPLPSYKPIESNSIKKESFPVHCYNGGHECVTNSIGQATPKGRSPTDLRVDASEGFIPLWEENVTLHYRFNKRTLQQTNNPEGTKATIRRLLSAALNAWGDAAPIRFKEVKENWDFEIAVRNADDGGTLASAFFPDAGRHKLWVYPLMFDQPEDEQVDTLIHELGHVFGLRHFFADVDEAGFPSELFGTNSKFSIMNYEDPDTPEQEESALTNDDLNDLYRLYQLTWSKELKQINGTPIVLFKPFHSFMP
ncbi:hypothetical protein BGZ93_002475 [Podila epicladia]|nr:hypothetical protein BGZ92_005895 [Podila epicladia]KAG0082378.1 hypothetical protein BGZ93_002475 [Podila epicladia]